MCCDGGGAVAKRVKRSGLALDGVRLFLSVWVLVIGVRLLVHLASRSGRTLGID